MFVARFAATLAVIVLLTAIASLNSGRRAVTHEWARCQHQCQCGLPTLVVTHQLQVERRTGKVRQSETDVRPLCYATNLCCIYKC